MKSKRVKMSIGIIALLIYFIFIVGFAIYSSFAIYHLWQFCEVGDLCKPVAIGYGIVSGAIIVLTLVFSLINILALRS
jgi:hypothetical protein